MIFVEFSIFFINSVQYESFVVGLSGLVDWRENILFLLEGDILVLLEFETTLTAPTSNKAETIPA